jgi:hypothetical protein
MTDIKPWVHILVGLVIGSVSFFLKMYIFMVPAGALVLWGLFKIPRKPHAQHQPPISVNIARCPFCHHNIGPHFNFCPNCGAYLKYNRGNPNLYHGSQNQHHNREHNQVRRVN